MSYEPNGELTMALRRLSAVLGMVGLGSLALAVLVLILAFTGYDTPQAVNKSALIAGSILGIIGSLCLSAGKSFVRAANDPAASLGPALKNMYGLFFYCLILVGLAVLVVGSETARFLERIVSR